MEKKTTQTVYDDRFSGRNFPQPPKGLIDGVLKELKAVREASRIRMHKEIMRLFEEIGDDMGKLIPCKKCDTTKPVNEFYSSTTYKSGHGECKKCVRQRVNASHRTAHRMAYYSSEAGKQAARDKFQVYLSKYPGRHAVRVATNAAVAAGKLIKPDYCSECGSEGYVEAHHDDYNHPLSVRWLCRDCHWDWHNHNTPIYQSH